MATRVHSPSGGDTDGDVGPGDQRHDEVGAAPGSEIDRVASLGWMTVARLSIIAVLVAATRFGLHRSPLATIMAVVIGAAWLIGRVD